jgi:glycosyltransferase involved in cell wall biosynthesis
MKILIGIPTPEYIYHDFALENLPDIVSHTRKTHPDWEIVITHQTGVRTDSNRNAILKEALEGNFDYILWLDADMLYPPEILTAYFDASKELDQAIDVIGCLYFKRNHPYNPIAYVKSGEVVKPFKTLLPSAISPDTLYEVDGVGYGGMMVNMKVYEKLGDKKWTRYGPNFHIPEEVEGKLTHDLQFCTDVKKAGMSVKLHGGVRPGHLAINPVDIEDWRRATEEEFDFKNKAPRVIAIIPTTNEEEAMRTADIMHKRAGIKLDIKIAIDKERKGFVKTFNEWAKKTDHDVVIYTAQDALVGQNWLLNALRRMMVTNAGLLAFNDGKWNGNLASFGMIQRNWVKDIYGGDFLYSGYSGHYCDTELTQIAKQQGRYTYAENAVMIEVDWDKARGKGKGTNPEDKKLYNERKKNGFDGLVTDKALKEEFS